MLSRLRHVRGSLRGHGGGLRRRRAGGTGVSEAVSGEVGKAEVCNDPVPVVRKPPRGPTRSGASDCLNAQSRFRTGRSGSRIGTRRSLRLLVGLVMRPPLPGSRYRGRPPSLMNGGPVSAERHRDNVDSETFRYEATSRLSSNGETGAVASAALLMTPPAEGCRVNGRTRPRLPDVAERHQRRTRQSRLPGR